MYQLEFKDITKEYDGEAAVKNVNFGIEKSEFVFLVGESGAGKTTLVKMLIREQLPTQGEIIFDETNVLEIPQKDIHKLRRRIGVVFQDFKIMESKTVSENVAVALEVVDSDAHVTSEVVPNVLNLVGLQNKADSFPKQLSGGEKQRLAIARALAHEPDILVADEPTGMIDPDAAEEVMSVLEKINSLGTTILMATHNQNIVNKFKKRVIRIEDGEIVSDKEGGQYNDKKS